MKIKQYEKYEKVPSKYRWDLESILKNKTIDKSIEEALNLYKKLIEIKDSKYENSSKYLDSLKLEDELAVLMNKINNYITNKLSQNVVDHKILSLSEKFNYDMYLLQQKMGPEDTKFFENSEKISEWIKKSEYSNYFHSLSSHLEWKKHILPREIEDFKIKEERGEISAYQVFEILTNSELNYGHATSSNGKKIPINEGNRLILLKNLDAKIRKTTFLSYRQAFLNHKGTLSNLLYQHFKHISTWAKLKKFDSAIQYLTFDDRIDKKFLETLYKTVQTYIPLFKKVREYHGKFYKKKFGKKMTKFDTEVELVTVNSEYSIEEAQRLVLQSIKVFGEEYYETVKQAFNQKWVDYMPVKNKRKGAYSIGGSFGIDKKYILMNFDGTLRSVETLAHEMGHSMHSFYSDKNHAIRNSQYPIFLAEIASIFNELMLFDHLLKITKSDKTKFYILGQIIFGFMATVLRQTEWSNYEYNVYNAIDEGKPIGTYESLSKIYYDNSLKYDTWFKKEKYQIENQFGSIYVPHYYYNFYVYKYAIGQICANIFYRKYQLNGENALDSYIKQFLSAGGHDFPLKILNQAGIDLYDKESYKLGFKVIEKRIEEWIELGKKIFNVK